MTGETGNDAWLIRVAKTPNVTATSAREAVEPVFRAVSRLSTYAEVDLRDLDFQGFDALRWEFTVKRRVLAVYTSSSTDRRMGGRSSGSRGAVERGPGKT